MMRGARRARPWRGLTHGMAAWTDWYTLWAGCSKPGKTADPAPDFFGRAGRLRALVLRSGVQRQVLISDFWPGKIRDTPGAVFSKLVAVKRILNETFEVRGQRNVVLTGKYQA